MIIWFALLIPLLTLVFLLINYKSQLVWQEVGILLLIPALILGMVRGCSEYMQTRDTEYWGGWVREAHYYEDWNEYIHQTCSRQVYVGTDSDGNAEYETEYYDCSYVRYHPEYWTIYGSNGEEISIGKQRFDQLCQQFGNKTFVDMHRHYHTNDGDMYKTVFQNQPEKLEPITTRHEWENRVQASKSVFKFDKPKNLEHLYSYPDIFDSYKQHVVLGNNCPCQDEGIKQLEYVNAVLGSKKRFRMYVLIFTDQPLQKGIDQESLWGGGNKNELNVAIGIDKKQNIQWCHVFSWTDYKKLPVSVKTFIMNQQKLDLKKLANWILSEADQWWVKKNFRDFDYLSIDPTMTEIIIAFLLALISSGVIGYIIVTNEFKGGK